jgi:hypothetical protein
MAVTDTSEKKVLEQATGCSTVLHHQHRIAVAGSGSKNRLEVLPEKKENTG